MDTESTMKEIALSHPAVARTLDRLQINYCCNSGGKLSLAEACQNANQNADAVLTQLKLAQEQPTQEPTWDPASPSDLIRHILATHHAFTRSELDRLDKLVNKIVERHVEARPELKEIGECYRALCDDLSPHLMKEENILFPYIEALEKHRHGEAPMPAACFGSIENPLRQMHSEHEAVTAILTRMRQLTNGYTPPADVCTSYRTTLQSLEALEADLLRHIELENDVLFPQARELAESS